MPKKKLKVGMIGCGDITFLHYNAYSDFEYAELYKLMESEKGMGWAVFDDGYHKLSLAIYLVGEDERVQGFIDRSFRYTDLPLPPRPKKVKETNLTVGIRLMTTTYYI